MNRLHGARELLDRPPSGHVMKVPSCLTVGPLALALLLIPCAADAQQRTYRPAQRPHRHGERADPPAQRSYLLQERSASSTGPKPTLAVPLALHLGGGALGGAGIGMFIAGAVNGDVVLAGTGLALASIGGLSFLVGFVHLFIRVAQRRRWRPAPAHPARPQYGFEPIIAPERQLYGLAGTVSF